MSQAARILITPRSLTAEGLDSVAELGPLRQAGFELVSSTPGKAPDQAELSAILRSGGVVGWLAGVERIPAEVLAHAEGLRVIARNGVGVDNVDTQAAAERGIEVRNAPGSNAQGVAELALAHALSLLRSIPQGNAALHEGRWERTKGRELGDLRVGIVGYGVIGRRVAKLFAAIGSQVAAYDPFATGPADHELFTDLDELLARSDILSLHAPPASDGPLLNAARLARLPQGALVVNTARALLVDSEALYEALATGAIGGYAVDVFEQEPPQIDRLLAHPRTVMSAHVGGFTDASVRRATAAAVMQLLDVLVGDGR